MAKTINELIYNLRFILKENKTDDLRYTDRNIEFVINYLREKLIVQQLQKGRSISSNIKQDLGQINVQKVDMNDNGFVTTNKIILRTVNKIPQPIELDQKDGFTYIGGLDKQSPIDFKTKALSSWNKYNKYSSKLQTAYYHNGYIYIENCPNPNMKYINIEGIFANPREASLFTKPNGQKCYDPNVDAYPISSRDKTISCFIFNYSCFIFIPIKSYIIIIRMLIKMFIFNISFRFII